MYLEGLVEVAEILIGMSTADTEREGTAYLWKPNEYS